MGRTLVRAIMLVGLGVVAGLVHARMRPVMVSIPVQTAATTGAAGERVGAAAPAGGTEAPVAPEATAAAPRGGDADAGGAAPVEERPAATAPVPSPAPAPEAAPTASSEVATMVSVAQAKELFDQQVSGAWQGYFIDARRYVEFTEGHIRGAMHVDKRYFDGAVPKKVRDFLPGSSVVIYCHGEACTDSEAVAKRLIALKMHVGPIYILREGYPGWVQAGYPVDTGPEVGF
jgi:rhodanese-related sulfurtransferase